MEQRINRRKVLTGTVVSDKMMKTRVVQVRNVFKHAKYQKPVQGFVKFKAHDEENKTKIGDVVRIMESRPLSREKRWVIQDVVEANKIAAAK